MEWTDSRNETLIVSAWELRALPIRAGIVPSRWGRAARLQRISMLALVVLLAQVPAASADAGELTPLPVVIVNPGNLRTAISNPELFAALSAVLRARTHTVPFLVDGYEGSCRGDLKCLALDRRVEPLLPTSPALLWVSSRAGEAGTRVVITVLDSQRVAKGLRNDAVSSIDLQDVATTTTSNYVVVRSADDVHGVLERMVDVELSAALKRAELWGPFGSVAILGLPAAAWVDLGQGRRRVTPEAPTLTGVRPGPRRLHIVPDGYEASDVDVIVSGGGNTEVAPSWVRVPNFGFYARRTTMIAGLGAALVGGIAWGVSAGDARLVCLTNGPVSDACASVSPGAATWGSGLIAGGIVVAGGSLLLGNEYELPWLAWLLGALSGSAVAIAVEISRN